jgi:cardiolipin synthase A/B
VGVRIREVSNLPDYLPFLMGALYALLELAAIVAAVEALLGNRSSQSVIAWTLLLILFPPIGLPLYLMFGGRKFSGYVNARRSGNEPLQRMVRELSTSLPVSALAELTPGEADHRVLSRLASLPFFAGNSSRLLIDGDATFNAIFDAIDAATEYVLVQFYIVKDDGLGRKLQHKLIRKAQQNVRIYFLYDAIGSNGLPGDYLQELLQAGVETAAFSGGGLLGGHPFRVNFRNHRKIVVVDGRCAFVGGHNVGDEYLGLADDPDLRPWRDTHVCIEGPAVLGVQLAFVEDWYWMTQQIPPLRTDPVFAEDANQRILVLPSGPADELDTCGLLFTELIHSARKRIWIVTPYFVPDDPVVSALKIAALRGVDVRIMLPEKADHLLIYLAKFSYLEETLLCGVKFFNYQRGFLHNKVLLVDQQIAGVGTANLDNRSFRLNFEITLLFVHQQMVDDVERMLLRDFESCREMTLLEITQRSLWFKLATRIARLFSPIL